MVFKKLAYCIFGKISNGILFIVLGFGSMVAGIVSSWWIFFLSGAIFAVLGIILSFIRETMYQEAIAEVSKLRSSHRILRRSVNVLHGKVDLLDQDLKSAQERVSRLESFKLVDFGDGRRGVTGREGPAFNSK